MKKFLFSISTFFFLLLSTTTMVLADSNKNGYIYSYWGEPIPSAIGLTHARTYDRYDLNVKMSKPEDVFAYENKLYIVDSEANSLIILNDKYEVVSETTLFFKPDDERTTCVLDIDKKSNTPAEDLCGYAELKEPSGVAVTKDAIYIADKANSRLVKIGHDLKFITEFGTPNDKTFEYNEQTKKQLKYQPTKVAVDKTGRIYVIALDVYEGIIELNVDGSFNRFTGVNPVSVSVFEAIQRKFASEAQLAQMQLFLPTSFTNMIIDNQGFIYATAAASGGGNDTSMIKSINPKGLDVLKRNGFTEPKGDVIYNNIRGKVAVGPSQLIDIALNETGMYTVLDKLRGRLFTYDNEGRLLYISAEQGFKEGELGTPVSLTYFGNNLVVLDQNNKSLEIFKPTDFGNLVNQAVEYHYKGDFEKASETWSEVAKLNTNYEIAYIGIGKSLLRQGKYKEAMENFKIGKDKAYYAKAFEGYRKEIINDNFGYIMTGVTIGIIFLLRKPLLEIFKAGKEE